MADEFAINIRGAADVTRALYQFSERLGDRVTLLALRSGANFMLKQIRAAAPVKTGRLRRAITVRGSRIHTRRRDGIVGVYISIRSGKNRKDQKGAYYGRFVENGYNRGSKEVNVREAISLGDISLDHVRERNLMIRANRRNGQRTARIQHRHGGTHVPGRHFVSSTFNSSKTSAAKLIIDNIEQAGRQLANQIGFRS